MNEESRIGEGESFVLFTGKKENHRSTGTKPCSDCDDRRFHKPQHVINTKTGVRTSARRVDNNGDWIFIIVFLEKYKPRKDVSCELSIDALGNDDSSRFQEFLINIA